MKIKIYTKWKPVMYFYHDFQMYLLMARKNHLTGFIKFRHSKLNRFTHLRDEKLIEMYNPTNQLGGL